MISFAPVKMYSISKIGNASIPLSADIIVDVKSRSYFLKVILRLSSISIDTVLLSDINKISSM